MQNSSEKKSIILFDGMCNFCNTSVNKIIKYDKKNVFKFAAIQSDAGKKLLIELSIDILKIDSILLIENNTLFTKSTAVLKIAKQLSGLYKLSYSFIIIPLFIRDTIYDFIAKNRYKWFGKKESCMIPSIEVREKFLI
jgi:predicted DCC family thiol-disulfide oxidoreductase YuxK